MKTIALAAAAASLLAASSASATVLFTSTFEDASVGYGQYITVSSIDGWTSNTHGIEIQNHAAGNPAPTGGNKFVELDTYANSSMFRTIGAGTYDLSFLFSPRPGNGYDSNGIEVLINNIVLGTYDGSGGRNTDWSTENLNFTTTGGTLTFKAVGKSDSYGGYLDNISLSTVKGAVPEPATWAMMIFGFGMAGVALRRRSAMAAI